MASQKPVGENSAATFGSPDALASRGVGGRTLPGSDAELEQKITPAYFSVKGAARYSSLSRSLIYKLLDDNRLRAKQFGTRNLISRASLDEFIRNLPERKPKTVIPDYKNNKVEQ